MKESFVVSDKREQYVTIPYVLALDTTLLANDKIVYMGLSSFRNGATGKCFPSHTTLAARCGLSRNTVTASIGRLRGKGYIGAEKVGNKWFYALLPTTAQSVTHPQPAQCSTVEHSNVQSVPSNHLNSNQEESPKKEMAEQAPPSSPPAPPAKKWTTPEYDQAKKHTAGIRRAIGEATGHPPPPGFFGRDLKLVYAMLKTYPEPEFLNIVRNFFQFREKHGLLLSIPVLFRNQELLAHLVRTGGARRKHV